MSDQHAGAHGERGGDLLLDLAGQAARVPRIQNTIAVTKATATTLR